ncbi:MAG: alpha/beta fold hydrolase, partial [Hyphococcus sp.]
MTVMIVLGVLALLAGVSGCATWSAGKAAPMIGDLVDIEGVKMHVADIGPRDSNKPPVVLIHGASVNMLDMKIALGE